MRIVNKQLQSRYYEALLNRDAHYVGQFYAAVTTTSIGCLPTCSARKPREENMVYYTSLEEARQAGYRPCKICKPK